MIVMGLYSVLWGKYKEYKENEAEAILEPVKGNTTGNNVMMIGDIEANDIEMIMQKNEANRAAMAPAFAISAPIPAPPMIAMETPKP